jgi:hypothetical protein
VPAEEAPGTNPRFFIPWMYTFTGRRRSGQPT